MTMIEKPLLSVSNLRKRYNDHVALDGISFDLMEGDILGIVGANGSGKSTLMNIFFGNEVIANTGGYEGALYLKGKKIHMRSPQDAINNGFAMVHQEFALFPELNIAENIKIRKERTYPVTDRLFSRPLSKLDDQKNHQESVELMKKLGIDIDTAHLIKNLSTNIQQFVEIARELDRQDIKILILDEPTAVMNKEDCAKLLKALSQLSQTGVSILFISHRLEEVQAICNKVLVLRDGKQVSSYDKEAIHPEKLAQDMIGKSVRKIEKQKRITSNDPILKFEDYHVAHSGDEVCGVHLSVNQGEILGITSLAGQGKLGIAKGIMGSAKTYGKVWYKGVNILERSYSNRIKAGIYVLCEDRKNTGLLMQHSIKDNIVFTANHVLNKFNRWGFLKTFGFFNTKEVKEHVSAFMDQFEIQAQSMDQPVWELSGGNQQKVCMARALTLNPEVLFLSEPTRGVDIAAKEKILESIKSMNEDQHTTVVVASSELDELIRLCDRIVVMYEGQIEAILDPTSSLEEFGYALSGIKGENHEISKTV